MWTQEEAKILRRKSYLREYQRVWYALNRHTVAQQRKKFRVQNPEHKTLQARRYYTKNKESHRLAMKKWAAENPEKARYISHDYRVRRRGQKSGKIYWDEVWNRFTGSCPLCTKPLHIGVQKFHMDHIHPLSQGGLHATHNLQVVHSTCNLRKHTKVG